MTAASPSARAIAALGHDARLSIFRLMAKAGDEGLRVSDIGDRLGIAPSMLAHHLSTLVDAGLVLQDRQGREGVQSGRLSGNAARSEFFLPRNNRKSGDLAMTDGTFSVPGLRSTARHLWQVQRVWLVSALIFAVLAAFDPSQAGESALFSGSALFHTAPYLLLSTAIAAWAGATDADNLIARAFTGAPLSMIGLAGPAGGLSPVAHHSRLKVCGRHVGHSHPGECCIA